MAKIQHSNREWRIIIETRHKYKYTIADVKKIIKLLCVDNKHIQKYSYLLKKEFQSDTLRLLLIFLNTET